MYDPLTGLADRRLFEDRTRHALARAAREGWSTAVLAIDIDRFADINEAFGHSVGDQALAEVARRLEASLRPYDNVGRPLATVSRLGGDEFLVTCENVRDDEAARSLAHRITTAFEEPLAVGPVSAGIGIAVVPAGGSDVGAVILDAEAALRRAKSRGAGRVEVFCDQMRSGGRGTTETGDELREGLEAGQFVLHYQPKVVVADERVVGVEALVRWDHPATGLVAPDRFIALAEQSGLIVDLGAWVIEEACRQTQEWHARFADRPPLEVAVNVSAGQFQPELVTTVADVLARTGMAASNVCLELTEAFVMADVDSAIVILGELKRLGVTVSIDDFGTGYSSLAYLRRLPIDELKIDRSFVDGLGREPEDTAIVASVVAMAHAMELRVVAEGVETEEQLERLRVLGCDEAQGFYFSRPLPPGVLEVSMADGWASLSRRHAGRGDDHGRSRREAVVLADDAPEVRQLAAVSLSTGGYEVHQADSGRAAVELARVVRPTCVVLDVRMPEMDGFEACRALRADPRTAGCTIVMLTAVSDPVDKVEGFSAGADDYIVKPFTPRDLLSRVRGAVARRQDRAAAPEGPTA